MSRHIIAGRALDTRVVVGWDQPLRSFFVQVIDEAAERELRRLVDTVAGDGISRATEEQIERMDVLESRRITVWLGASRPGEIPTIGALQRLVRPHADLAPAVAHALQADHAAGIMNVETDWRGTSAGGGEPRDRPGTASPHRKE